MSETFGADARLHVRAEFTAVQDGGRRVATRYFILLGAPNTRGRDRFGVIASRRLGNAVVRNRAKRRLRELFRCRDSGRTSPGGVTFDLVLIPRRELVTAPYPALESEFARSLTRLRTARV